MKRQTGKYLRDNWIAQMTSSLERLHPELTHDQVEDFVIKTYMERYTDHEAMLYNSYENTVANTSLGEVLDWLERDKPLIAESGVYFYPKHVKRNVNIEIIKEHMLDARTVHKKEMFKALEAGDAFTAAVKDIQQANDKKAANSGYGAEGQSSSFLFNVHSAMSVTSCGRGQLSTAILCYENIFGDFVKFFNMDEFYTFIEHVISEKPTWEFDLDEIVNWHPSKKQWIQRFESKFLHYSLYDHDQLVKIYDSLSDEMRTRTFYKANLRAFLMRNHYPADLYADIASTKCEFIDPNDVPKEIADDVKHLAELVTEFVNYKFSWHRYEDRARYQKRSVVIVSDTDSTFLMYNNILNFVLQKVLPMRLFKKGEKQDMYRLKVLNVLSCFASSAIAATLWNYLGYVNVAEEDRGYIKMKNEFYYSRVIVTYAKKSYIGLMTRKEAFVYPKPKMDVKGVNFFKSTASEKTSKFIYDDVLMGELLQPKDGKISLRRVYKTISDFQHRIADEIKAGDMGFLKRSIKVKSADAYKDPYRISQYRAAYVWNQICDDKDRIELPATVTIVKVKLQNKKDLAALAPWPHIYDRILHLFETNPEFGDHPVVKNGKERMVKGKGINSIALPVDFDEVPDWVLAVIDVETLVSDNMRLFTQLYKPLGFSEVTVNHNKNQMKYYCNIVRI
ncbi:MAG: hypothetical protein NC311_06660 [Muribaculaceae bacterium]|nr:hypothetical protein [Muribaculaceae bacterium]